MAHAADDPAFRELIDEHAPVRQLGTGFDFTEGPIWHPLERRLLFSDMPGDVRRAWDGREVGEVMRPTAKGNGMTLDADLALIVCEHASSSVVRLREGRREVLASHFEGRELNSPNDVCVAPDGAIWFTDPTYGRQPVFGVPRPVELGFQGVYRITPGAPPGAEPRLMVDRFLFDAPNGLCFSPDERRLYVNDTVQALIRVFDVGPGGVLSGGRVFAEGIRDALRPGVPDGMKCDARGNIWVTGPGGVWVHAPDGRRIGRVAVPELVANLHWGGDGWRTLFLCASTSLYAVQTLVGPRPEPFMRARPAPAAASPPAGADGGLRIEPSRCALLIQDMQNDVIAPGGAFADSGAPAHAAAQGAVANCVRLAERCRVRGIPVIHVWFVCEPGHPAMRTSAPLFEGLVAAGALVRGTWGAAPVAGLEPRPGDLVVEKMTMSAWESGRLEPYLKGAERDAILNCGAWTNMSVEHTARTGADKGYRVVTVEDACATIDARWHRASIDFAMANVATVTTTAEVLARL